MHKKSEVEDISHIGYSMKQNEWNERCEVTNKIMSGNHCTNRVTLIFDLQITGAIVYCISVPNYKATTISENKQSVYGFPTIAEYR